MTLDAKEITIRRAAIGFLIAPMLPGFYSTVFFAQPWAFPAGLVLAYPSTLFAGLPLFLWLRHRSWLRWWHLTLAGTFCALPSEYVYWRSGQPEHFEPFGLSSAAMLLFWGAFSGASFWLLAVSGDSPLSIRSIVGLKPHH